MTKNEALKLALEALETNNKAWRHLADSGDAGFWEAEEQPFYELSVKAITAIKEALAQPEPNYKKALEVWLDKTEWVQETVKPHELGMHRADVLKQRIEATLAQPKQHQDWCASSTQMLMSMPPKPAPCNCKPPQRTWVGLSDEDKSEICDMTERDERDSVMRLVEAKLKEKNT
jgi:hypothetical protein